MKLLGFIFLLHGKNMSVVCCFYSGLFYLPVGAGLLNNG